MTAQVILALCAHLALESATSLPGNLQPPAQGLRPVSERIGVIQREVACIAERFSLSDLVESDRLVLGRRLTSLRDEQRYLENDLLAVKALSTNPNVAY
jgi:hypothetical protein